MNEQKDWWDEISAQQQELIDNALAEVNAGKLISHDEVMRKYSKWIKK
jgi:predicted transcriptional regulator